MRLSWQRLAVLMTAVLIAIPVLAQFQPGGGRGVLSLAQLVTNKSVETELKMTEEQIAKFKTINDDVNAKYKDELDKAGKDFKAKAEVRKKINEEATTAVTKDLATILKPEQVKRLKQIELQVQGLTALTSDTVAKDLALTDEQKTKIKGLTDDLATDTAAIFKDAGKDFKAAFKKVTEMRTATFEKATSTLTDDQKKKWKDMTGDKFDLVVGKGGKGA